MPTYIVCLEATATVRAHAVIDAADSAEAVKLAAKTCDPWSWVGVGNFENIRATKIVDYVTGEKLYEESRED